MSAWEMRWTARELLKKRFEGVSESDTGIG
jgi:hypothetical protein